MLKIDIRPGDIVHTKNGMCYYCPCINSREFLREDGYYMINPRYNLYTIQDPDWEIISVYRKIRDGLSFLTSITDQYDLRRVLHYPIRYGFKDITNQSNNIFIYLLNY